MRVCDKHRSDGWKAAKLRIMICYFQEATWCCGEKITGQRFVNLEDWLFLLPSQPEGAEWGRAAPTVREAMVFLALPCIYSHPGLTLLCLNPWVSPVPGQNLSFPFSLAIWHLLFFPNKRWNHGLCFLSTTLHPPPSTPRPTTFFLEVPTHSLCAEPIHQ